MTHLKTLTILGGMALVCAMTFAQAPSLTIDPQRHGNLAAAQDGVVQAYAHMTEAQRDNDAHLGGHAQRAKELLSQANQEIALAAAQADAHEAEASGAPPSAGAAPQAPPSEPPAAQPPPTQPTNVTGNWTIYADNVRQPGSSLKQVQLSQEGNIISGTFHGPHQKGHLQGWINGNHVEFSTDTREVLTFRGEVTPNGMSGMYGANGEHASWKAQRN